jgi:hypothetical protein
LAVAGSEFIAGSPKDLPWQDARRASYGVLDKKYANDTFYSNKHIQILHFLPRTWHGSNIVAIPPSPPSWFLKGVAEVKRGDKVTVGYPGTEPGVGLVVNEAGWRGGGSRVIFSGWMID